MRLEGRSSPAAMSHHSDDGMLGNPGLCTMFLRRGEVKRKMGMDGFELLSWYMCFEIKHIFELGVSCRTGRMNFKTECDWLKCSLVSVRLGRGCE